MEQNQLCKYPRTAHLQGSRKSHGDDLEDVPWKELAGKNVVIEEKVDGTNVGISFSEQGDLLLQSRGHYLRGGPRERQYDLLKQWAAARQEELYCVLGSRYILYGEWLFAKHTVFYDALPHYLLEFDVLDTENNVFLSTPARKELLFRGSYVVPVEQVLVLWYGTFDELGDVTSLITRSNFITCDRANNLRCAAVAAGVPYEDVVQHTDMHDEMEGLYIKWEEDGVVKGRYKFVRDTFTNSILEQKQHWHDRPIIQNRLLPGCFGEMFATQENV